jgi:hypothetical protein
MRRAVMAIGLTIALSGCAVEKVLVPTGGSRSDGTVELSYEFGMFEKPQVDLRQGTRAAAKRCQAWGYADAEPFGGQKNLCQQFNGYGNCIRTLVTIQYQCTGARIGN